MKEDELRKSAKCAACKKPFGASGAPFFYRVKIDQHIVDMAAVRRQSGLAMMLGSAPLAGVMGSNEDMTKVVNSVEMTLCADCCTENPMTLMEKP
jgi:hypothetical protein